MHLLYIIYTHTLFLGGHVPPYEEHMNFGACVYNEAFFYYYLTSALLSAHSELHVPPL